MWNNNSVLQGALRYTFLSIILATFFYGCTMGPDYKRPHVGVTPPPEYRASSSSVTTARPMISLDDKWWEDFEDETLNHLVDEVFARNWDIRKAAARVLVVQSQFKQTRSDRFPEIAITGSASRDYRYLSHGGANQQKMGEQFNLSLAVSYELDLWGKLSRATEAARADLLQVEGNRISVIHTVIAETVSTYLEMEALERRIQLTRATIENYRRALELVEGRYERGLSDILTVRQARRELASAETEIPALKQELGKAQQKLSILAGHYPETRAARSHPDTYFKRRDFIPTGLPSELLCRRPDIRAAEASLQAATARIGKARAERFPSFSLTGSLGYVSTDLDDFLMEHNRFVNGGIDLLAPVFDAGKRKSAENAARAAYQEAKAEFADTILRAFKEVEGALMRREQLLEKRRRILKLVEEARLTLETSEKRYFRGVSSYLNVLEAQRSSFIAQESLVLADLAALTNRVGLHRALGGGWGEKEAYGTEDMLEEIEKRQP